MGGARQLSAVCLGLSLFSASFVNRNEPMLKAERAEIDASTPSHAALPQGLRLMNASSLELDSFCLEMKVREFKLLVDQGKLDPIRTEIAGPSDVLVTEVTVKPHMELDYGGRTYLVALEDPQVRVISVQQLNGRPSYAAYHDMTGAFSLEACIIPKAP